MAEHRMVIPGSMMDDLLMGTSMDEVLWGGPGDDTLRGGAGDDVLEGNAGADALDGGPGMDVATYTKSPEAVHINLSTAFEEDTVHALPPVRGGDAAGDRLTSIESIWGSMFSDEIRGGPGADRFFGFGGDDQIYGGDGADFLRGEDGNDSLFGQGGNDQLFGDMGNDHLSGGEGHDRLWGGKGNDELNGDAGVDTLEGGAGADILNGGQPQVTVVNENGLLGGDTAAYTLSPEAVTVNLEYAFDTDRSTVGAMGGHAEGDSFEGSALAGSESISHVTGSMYDDMLTGDENNNRLMGGDGDDTLDGGEGMDALMGQMGDDVLMGGDGADTLDGGEGADELDGGDGMDTADYSMSPEAVRINLSAEDRATNATVPTTSGGHAEGDTIVTVSNQSSVENITGTDFQDYLRGDDQANVLKGGDGDDWDNMQTTRGGDAQYEGGLFGEGGNDVLVGGDGMDYLDGGAGRDDIWGGKGNDRLIAGSGDDITIRSTTANGSTTKTYHILDDPTNPSTMGANIDDRAGLYGGAGDDTLVGGSGIDLLDGGSGNDTVSYAGRDTAVTVNLSDETVTVDIGGTDTAVLPSRNVPVVDVAADPLVDRTPDDTGRTDTTRASDPDVLISIENVTGGDGADAIIGDARANVLDGGEGNDTLVGGDGADTFVFDKDSGTDTITDFSRLDRDKLDLSAFELSTGQLRDALGANDTNISIDADGDGTADVVITLTGVETGDLSIDDFIL